jgi:tetratricopeptide (TPR) repeat protein
VSTGTRRDAAKPGGNGRDAGSALGAGAVDAAGRTTVAAVARKDAGTDRAGERAGEAKALCDQASNALDEGDFARAFELTVASLKLRKTARAYILRARAEQRLDRVDDALASLDMATEIAPTAGAVWEQRGRILWAARRRDEARTAFSRFLELDPKSPRAAEVLRLLNEPR